MSSHFRNRNIVWGFTMLTETESHQILEASSSSFWVSFYWMMLWEVTCPGFYSYIYAVGVCLRACTLDGSNAISLLANQYLELESFPQFFKQIRYRKEVRLIFKSTYFWVQDSKIQHEILWTVVELWTRTPASALQEHTTHQGSFVH